MGRKAFGLPASHCDAIDNKTPAKLCDGCGREFRGDRVYCDECRGVSSEYAYHGENYGDDE